MFTRLPTDMNLGQEAFAVPMRETQLVLLRPPSFVQVKCGANSAEYVEDKTGVETTRTRPPLVRVSSNISNLASLLA